MTQYREIAGKQFRKVVDSYIFNVTNRKTIVIGQTEKGWRAIYQITDKKGSFMEGTKKIRTLIEVDEKTLEAAGSKIFKLIDEEPSAQSKASMKYSEKNVKQIKLALNRKTDSDIIEILESKENIQGYIKELIRSDNK